MPWLLALLASFHSTAFVASQSVPQVVVREYAQVLFMRGRLTLYRQDSARMTDVRMAILDTTLAPGPARGVHIAWTPRAARGLALVLDEAIRWMLPLRRDTVEVPFRYPPQGSSTLRCQRELGCWIVIVNSGRGGYWRPTPNLTLGQMRSLATAIGNAAAGNAVTSYRLDLRQ